MERDIILSLIFSAYKTIFEPERWALILRELQGLVGAEAADICCHDFRSGKGELAIHSGCYDEDAVTFYNRHCSAINPWLHKEEYYRSEDVIWFGRQIVPHARLLCTDFYSEWLRPQGLFHRVSVVISRENDRAVYLSVLRGKNADCFQPAKLWPLQRLLPHMRQVLILHRLLVGQLISSDCPLAEIVHRLGHAAVVLGQERDLLAANESGEAMLAAGNMLSLGADGIGTADAADSVRLNRLINQAMRTAAGESDMAGGRMHITGGDGNPVPVEVVPMPSAIVAGQDGPAVALIVSNRDAADGALFKEKLRWWPVVVGDGAAAPTPMPNPAPANGPGADGNGHGLGDNVERLRRLYALTQAEARLAILLTSGVSLPAAAERLGVGMATARTHLQRIYGKTYTHHQAELVALMLLGPAKIDVRYEGSGDADTDTDQRCARPYA
jgi:DNA-binding CsgD family transcriptional regulator